MNPDIDTERRALALFRSLLDSPSGPASWEPALTAESPEVAACVRAMLARHLEATRQPALGWTSELPPPPAELGGFRLGRELGRGGMGVVFEGERDLGGLRQRAAIKLIAGDQVVAGRRARFLHERGIVARLQHPRIARLLDGGEGPGGELWYAMELIDGDIITRHCDSHRLDLRQRVTLLVELCDAVAHAHRHSILHRDIKPSNVLVDGEGHLTLIDFGIAKSLDAVDDGLTRDRAPMTPRYAAPEQLRGEAPTTSSDIWQLGALGYELLAGVPAREREDSRIVPPSRHPELAAPGNAALRRQLAGDLDAILMRALREEPEQRYGSATELAGELRDWLHGRPVAARRGERGYLIRRFVRVHRWAVGFAGLALIATLVGGIASLLFAREAQRQAAEAENVAALLAEMFVSSTNAPNLSSMSLGDFFANATGIALEDPRLTPKRRTDLLYDLSVRAKDLRDMDLAERAARGMLEHAPAIEGPSSLHVAVSHDFVAGTALMARGRAAIAEAEEHLAAAEAIYRKLDLLENIEYSTTHLREVIRIEHVRGDSAAMVREARRTIELMRKQGKPLDFVLNMQAMLLWALSFDEQLDAAAAEAAEMVRTAERTAVDQPALGNMLNWLRGMACRDEARTNPEAALVRCRELLGEREQAPRTRVDVRALLGLGEAQAALGERAAAIASLRRGEAALLAIEGENLRSADLQALREALARTLLAEGEAEQSAAVLEPLLEFMQEQFGAEHPDSVRLELSLAEAELALGRVEQARARVSGLPSAALPPVQAARHEALLSRLPRDAP